MPVRANAPRRGYKWANYWLPWLVAAVVGGTTFDLLPGDGGPWAALVGWAVFFAALLPAQMIVGLVYGFLGWQPAEMTRAFDLGWESVQSRRRKRLGL